MNVHIVYVTDTLNFMASRDPDHESCMQSHCTNLANPVQRAATGEVCANDWPIACDNMALGVAAGMVVTAAVKNNSYGAPNCLLDLLNKKPSDDFQTFRVIFETFFHYHISR
jgi:hypothetical protein